MKDGRRTRQNRDIIIDGSFAVSRKYFTKEMIFAFCAVTDDECPSGQFSLQNEWKTPLGRFWANFQHDDQRDAVSQRLTKIEGASS